MIDPAKRDAVEPTEKTDPEALVLRGRPRPVVRFRRGAVIGLAAAFSSSLVALAWIALDPPAPSSHDREREPQIVTRPSADALAGAPASYADVPVLGPPLPGDLGRPMLEQQRKRMRRERAGGSETEEGSLNAQQALEAERQRSAAARRDAFRSPVLVKLEHSGANAQAAGEHDGTFIAAPSEAETEVASSGAGAEPKPQIRRGAPSPWTLSAGTIIPASLITGLNSDLPGIVIAQVTDNVRDSATGRTVLIPQGARLLGRYDSAVALGQNRALLVWERIIFPDGRSVELGEVPATDAAGRSGLHADVDGHDWQMLKGVILSTVLGLGNQLGAGRSEIARAIRESAQRAGGGAGEQLVGRTLAVKPTLKVPPGRPVLALLDEDLVLAPWEE